MDEAQDNKPAVETEHIHNLNASSVQSNPPTQPEKPKRKLPLAKLLVVGIVILVTVFAFGLIGYLLMGQNKSQENQVAETQVSAPSPTPDPTAGWKTYKGEGYSIKYPANYFIYEFGDKYSYVDISDVENPIDIPSKMSADGHTIIGIGVYQGSMPESFPYTNGSDLNPTIKSFSLNSYSGIRGSQTSTLGEGEAVYLSNPNGGYVVITKEIDDKYLFDQILSTFKFTDQASSADEANNINTSSWISYESPKVNGTSFKGYTIKYPQDWEKTSDSSEVSSLLNLTKGNYAINIRNVPTDSGPCTKQSKILINSGIDAYRDEGSISGNKIYYGFCVTSVGFIYYDSAIPTDQKILSEMDEIIKTIKIAN